MPSSHGLGRGLSALIPGAPIDIGQPRRDDHAVLMVPPERISPNPLQPRRAFPREELESLASSLRAHGVLQPLVVTARSDGSYELVAGERRLRAAKLAGLAAVPIIIRSGEHTDRTKLELALVENVQRADLNPIDRAVAYQQLQGAFGLSQEEIAQRVGVARSSVAHSLRLLGLPRDMQEALQHGALTEGHAKVLAGIMDPKEQRAWFERILEQRLPVSAVAAAQQSRGRHTANGRGVAPAGDPNTRAKELALQRALGAKIHIAAHPRGGGSITIEYTDAEELDGIVRTILE